MATRDRVLRHPSAAPPVRGGGCHGPGLWSKRGRLQPRAGCQWRGRHRTRGRSRPAGSGRRVAGLQVAVIVPGLFLSVQLTCRKRPLCAQVWEQGSGSEKNRPSNLNAAGEWPRGVGGPWHGAGQRLRPSLRPALPARCPGRLPSTCPRRARAGWRLAVCWLGRGFVSFRGHLWDALT